MRFPNRTKNILTQFLRVLPVVVLVLTVVLLPQLAHATVLFSDDFTGTNGTPLTLHNSNWVLQYGTEPVIQDNALYLPGLQANIGLDNAQKIVDQCASIDVQFPFPDALVALGVRTGFDSEGYSYGYQTYINDADHSIAIVWGGGGTYNNYLHASTLEPFPSAGWHTYKLCAIGSRITVYIDNAVVAAADDTNITTPGVPQLQIGRAPVFIDNFLWEGESSVPTPTPTPTPNPTITPTPTIHVTGWDWLPCTPACRHLRIYYDPVTAADMGLINVDSAGNFISGAYGSDSFTSTSVNFTIPDNNPPWDPYMRLASSNAGLSQIIDLVTITPTPTATATPTPTPTPTPTIATLISTVEALNLQQGITNSLDMKLSDAQDALNATNSGLYSSAISKLNAFINEVEAQRGTKLTNAQADALHTYAANLITLLQG
jgi:hypothetical protein